MSITINEIADMICDTISSCANSDKILTYRGQAECITDRLIKNDVIRKPLPDIKENQVLYAIIANKVLDVVFKGMCIANGDIRLNFEYRGLHYHCMANDINKTVFVSRLAAEKQRRNIWEYH